MIECAKSVDGQAIACAESAFDDGQATRVVQLSQRDQATVLPTFLHPIEDEKAVAEDPTPQTLYTVGFDGAEVWGVECEPNLRVYLELWEGYLQPVRTTE